MGGGSIPVGAGALAQGLNTVNLTDVSTSDAVVTDTLRLTYEHTFVADNNALNFPVTAGTPISVGGFTASNIRVIDVTTPGSPRELLGTVSGATPTRSASLRPPARRASTPSWTPAPA